MNLDVKQYARKPFHVLAVRVTEENLADAALWCNGQILHEMTPDSERTYIKVNVRRPLHEKQTRAYIGDWLLRAGDGFRVYNEGAFLKSFDEMGLIEQEVPVEASPIIPSQGSHGNVTPGTVASQFLASRSFTPSPE